jgi:tetratricopeptide (TPR) repeat protein
VSLAVVYDAAPASQAFSKGAAASTAALKLDADSARAQQARSFLLLMRMEWAGAAAAARRALQLAPNDGDAKAQLAYLSAILGNSQQAVVMVRQVLQTDPRSAWGHIQLGGYLAAQGQLDEAVAADQAAIALQPGAEGFYEQLAVIQIQRGDVAAALAAAEHEPPGVWHDAAMMLALQAGSDHKAADVALQRAIAQYADTSPYLIAQAYAVRRDPDAVFTWLDRAWASHDAAINNLLWDPIVLRYRDDPRFAAFCRKVGLPTTTDAVAMK